MKYLAICLMAFVMGCATVPPCKCICEQAWGGGMGNPRFIPDPLPDQDLMKEYKSGCVQIGVGGWVCPDNVTTY